MSRRDVGDVVVRARGLARHLLDASQLRQLAHVSGSGALAGALEDVGYWPAPRAAGSSLPAARIVEQAIDHETLKRLGVLVYWLADRVALFSALFEVEVRDTLRIRIRELSDDTTHGHPSSVATPSGWPELRDVRRAVAPAHDLRALVRALARIGSPYAAPLATALRRNGGDLRRLETALDTTWTSRARCTAARAPKPIGSWVGDEIDLQNAWSALTGDARADFFIDGGRRLPRALLESISAERDAPTRRRRLARALRESALAGVFDDPDLDFAALEARARGARIASARRAARIDPIGAAPILEVILRLWSERADLRRIGWGVASGMSVDMMMFRSRAGT